MGTSGREPRLMPLAGLCMGKALLPGLLIELLPVIIVTPTTMVRSGRLRKAVAIPLLLQALPSGLTMMTIGAALPPLEHSYRCHSHKHSQRYTRVQPVAWRSPKIRHNTSKIWGTTSDLMMIVGTATMLHAMGQIRLTVWCIGILEGTFSTVTNIPGNFSIIPSDQLAGPT